MSKQKILIPLHSDLMNPYILDFIVQLADTSDFSLVFIKDSSKDHIPFAKWDETLEEYEIEYTIAYTNGNWIEDIKSLAEKYAVDLIAICGTKEKANEIIQLVERPTLIIPEEWQKKDIQKIGFASDNKSFQDSTVMTLLWRIAISLKAYVYIIHINDKPIEGWSLDENVENTLEFYLQNVEHSYEFMKNENIIESLLQFGREKKLDIMATMPRNHAVNHLSNGGVVTAELVKQTDIPVLTIS